MKYLLDTVTINTYLKVKNNFKYGTSYPKGVNLQNLVSFIENNSQNLLIHSATLFELYTKCFRSTLNRTQIKNNFFSLDEFIDDYRHFFSLNIQVINEKPNCYFDMSLFVNHINSNAGFDPFTYIHEKINYEINSILRYILLINLICSEVLFDAYGDIVDENLFLNYIEKSLKFIKNELRKYLNSYYFQEKRKNESVKSIDSLVFYVLTQFQNNIENKKTLVSTAEDVINFLADTLVAWNQGNLSGNEGAKKCNEILRKNIKSSNKYSDIQSLIRGKLDEFCSLREDLRMAPLERDYMLLLLNKTFIEKLKISKNDFSDYLILSSCDYIKEQINDDLVFLSFDDRLRTFIKSNGIYYNDKVYNDLYS